MIGIYDESGMLTQIMKVYPPGYLDGLEAHGMKGVPIPQELQDLKKGGSLRKEYFVIDGAIAPRPENPLPDTVRLKKGKSFEKKSMPMCTVFMGSESQEVPAGEFAIEAEVVGEYNLLVKCFPMQNKKVKVIVT